MQARKRDLPSPHEHRTMSAVHGGDVRALAARAGRHADAILDFSANVNPLGPPAAVAAVLREIAADPTGLARYPDPAYADVRAALARRHGVGVERIALGNGSAALIGAIVRAHRDGRCVLPVPAFSEYAKALRDERVPAIEVALAGGTYVVDAGAIREAVRAHGATLCILANPNNPTGALTPRADILTLAADLARSGCTLVVDEAFVDYVPHASAIERADDPNAPVVLRSLTKFFAIPGVRIGYAVAPPATVRRIMGALPSWPVGTIEMRIATAVLGDAAYEMRTRSDNARERDVLRDGLRARGLRVADGAADFLFADVSPLGTDAERFARTLLAHFGIAVRVCDDYRGLGAPVFVRVAVRSRADNERLLAAIAGSDFGADREADPATHNRLDEEPP
jgi:threonine-phosphate decarboxylase